MAQQTPIIDMHAIAQIESSGGRHVKSAISGDSVGTFQVRPIVAQEYKRVVGKDINLADPIQNQTAATWYLQEHIPQYLAAKGIPTTPEHVIASYNMGPAGFAKHFRTNKGDLSSLPSITAQYLKKYARLTAPAVAPLGDSLVGEA